jgi:hypothetical protein
MKRIPRQAVYGLVILIGLLVLYPVGRFYYKMLLTYAQSISNVPPNLGALTIPVTHDLLPIDEDTGVVTFRMTNKFNIHSVRASLTTAQASGDIITVDINTNGTSILGTKLSIDNTEKTSTTAATPATITNRNLLDDDEITIDVDQSAAGGAGRGLKIYILGAIPNG